MDVSGTTSASAGSSAAAAASAATSNTTVSEDQFLQLLTTQLQAQDPLNPMDSTSFTAQLAQFSSLEQLTNINTQLGSLQGTMSAGMIGKQVTLTNDETHTVTGVLFENNATYLELNSGDSVQLSDIKEIKGGA